MLDVQRATKKDLSAVMAIESRIFTMPWSLRSYEQLLELDTVHMWVVKQAEELIAYMLFQVCDSEFELHNIGVAPEWQGKGVGTLLLQKLLTEAKQRNCRQIFLQVRVSNEAAKLLYIKFGFEVVGIRPAYYQDDREDAYIMQYSA